MDNPESVSSSNTHSIGFTPHTAGKPLKSAAKQIVMNVYCKLRERHPDCSENKIIDTASILTGVSIASIIRMKKIRLHILPPKCLSIPSKKISGFLCGPEKLMTC